MRQRGIVERIAEKISTRFAAFLPKKITITGVEGGIKGVDRWLTKESIEDREDEMGRRGSAFHNAMKVSTNESWC